MTRHHTVLAGSPPAESLADSTALSALSAASGRSYDGQDHSSFSHPAIIPIHQPTRMAKECTSLQLLEEAEQEQQSVEPSLREECCQ